jgi:PIN domain nuclease of toxin-antitoxin system
MRILLDTHALIWWFRDQKKLSKRALQLMKDSRNVVLVSAASGLEIAIKENIGKSSWLPFVVDMDRWIAEEGFFSEPITLEQSVRAGLLPLHHRDPFDRLLVAQAQSLNIPVLSIDPALDRYGVKRIW